MKDLTVDREIIINLLFKKKRGRMTTGLIWLGIGMCQASVNTLMNIRVLIEPECSFLNCVIS